VSTRPNVTNLVRGSARLVHVNRRRVAEAKERVVGEARLQAHRPRVQQRLVAEDAERLMPVHDLNLLPDPYAAQQRRACEQGGEHHAAAAEHVGHAQERGVVHLEPVGHPSHADSVAAAACDDYDLVPLQDEALREGDHVVFDATGVGVEAVGHHADAVASPLQLARGAAHAAGAAAVQ
jgi:hypothetical protein